MKTYLTVYFGTVLMAMFLVPIVSRLAKRYRLVDAPGPRKVHETPIPRIGGIAIVVSTLALVVFAFFIDSDVSESLRETRTEFLVLLAAGSFIFVVGLLDDLRSLPGSIKLSCIIAASLAICASGSRLHSISLGTWFEIETGWTAWPLTLIWITTITVCMNFIDGLDGLAGGIAFIVCGMIAVMAFLSGQVAMVVLMLALLGSVTGFLFFNFYPAKIFMGDCGSMFLGFMIGAGSVISQTKTSTFVGLAIPFLAMGVPILDTGIAVIRRHVLERRSMFAPDRNHLHHRLLDLGLHQRTVVVVIYALTGISASLGVFMLTMEDGWVLGLFGIGVLLLLATFGCLHGRRYCEIVMALKRNRTVVQETRIAKHEFENIQMRMRNVTSFDSWWETLCVMAQKMHFQNLDLWNRHNGRFVMTHTWNSPGRTFSASKTMNLTFPIDKSGPSEWEVRARIWINGLLELSGHQAMLLTRLIDEFPPPAHPADLKDQDSEQTDLSKTNKKVGSSTTMTKAKALPEAALTPAPVDIMGIPVVPFESYDQALNCVVEIIESNFKSFWVAINPAKIYHAWHDPKLQSLLRRADVGICDGVGISIASKILYGRSIRQCTGCDLFFRLLPLASEKGWGVYLLGDSAESDAAARSRLQKIYPGLKIVGWQDGYFEDSDAVVRDINRSKAKLLFVAMGSPKQENWIWRHRKAIKANFCVGVGRSFDIASGRLTREPRVFRITATKFLYRPIRKLRKRWHIQKVLFPYFMRVVKKKLINIFVSG